MRILCKDTTGELTTMEITDITYDNNLYSENETNDKPVEGLYIIDAHKNDLCIENINQQDCDDICRRILIQGYYDLSQYGPYKVLT